jgi:hypothetical protein
MGLLASHQSAFSLPSASAVLFSSLPTRTRTCKKQKALSKPHRNNPNLFGKMDSLAYRQARRAPEALVDKSWIALQVNHVGPQPLGLTGNQASKLTLLDLVNVRLLQVRKKRKAHLGGPGGDTVLGLLHGLDDLDVEDSAAQHVDYTGVARHR